MIGLGCCCVNGVVRINAFTCVGPMEGCRITVEWSGETKTTNSDGYVLFEKPPRVGNYLIRWEPSLEGWQTKTATFNYTFNASTSNADITVPTGGPSLATGYKCLLNSIISTPFPINLEINDSYFPCAIPITFVGTFANPNYGRWQGHIVCGGVNSFTLTSFPGIPSTCDPRTEGRHSVLVNAGFSGNFPFSAHPEYSNGTIGEIMLGCPQNGLGDPQPPDPVRHGASVQTTFVQDGFAPFASGSASHPISLDHLPWSAPVAALPPPFDHGPHKDASWTITLQRGGGGLGMASIPVSPGVALVEPEADQVEPGGVPGVALVEPGQDQGGSGGDRVGIAQASPERAGRGCGCGGDTRPRAGGRQRPKAGA